MFFKEEEINDELVCPKCRHKFDDPRILPCGATLCKLCIEDELTRSEKTPAEFKCPSCSSAHQSAVFPANLVAARLVKKSSNEVYRGKSVEKLKECLNKIETDVRELEKNKLRFVTNTCN